MASPDSVFHLVCQVMTSADRHLGVHLDVEIDVKLQTHLAHQAFVDLDHAWHGSRGRSHLLADPAGRSGVENFMEGGIEQSPSVNGNENAGEECRPGIGALPVWTADESDRDANESGDRSERIRAMMPGVRLERGALSLASEAIHETKEQLFHDYHHDEDDESKGLRRMMRSENLQHAPSSDDQRGEDYA